MPSISSQAPRRRQDGRKRRIDGELLKRIAKLEALVKNVEGDSDEHGMTPRRIDDTPTGGVTEESSYVLVSNSHDRSRGNSNGTTGYQSQSPRLRLDR